MRRALVVVVTAVVVAAGVVGLRGATSFRADMQPAGTVSVVVVKVENKGTTSLEDDARMLWAVCSRSLSADQRDAAVSVAGDTLRAEVRPGLGDHQRRQVRGCLDDLTLRRVVGSVVSIETMIETVNETAVEP